MPVDALRMQTAFELMRQIDTTLDNDSVEKSRSFADALMERAEEILADENVYLTRVYQLCIKYTQEEEVERALALHLKVSARQQFDFTFNIQALPCLNVCYPPMHPTLAQHHYTIGWLFASLKGDENHLQVQCAQSATSNKGFCRHNGTTVKRPMPLSNAWVRCIHGALCAVRKW